MENQRKGVISDKAVLVGMITSALCTIVFLLITAVVVYFIYDCWIMFQHQLAGGNCIAQLNVPVIFSIPIGLGLIGGIVLTRKILKEENQA